MTIYYPEEIANQEIYGTVAEPSSATNTNPTTSSTAGTTTKTTSTSGVSQSNISPDRVIPVIPPQVPTANDTIGHSINTKTNKILGIYSFGKVGSLQVGEYSNGVSGDIRISPDGITARNAAGTNTFAIDGQTGDASFFGTIQAGSIVVGYVSSVGGTYTTTSATAAKVMLLPDANTGIVAYAQDGATVVFKVVVAGTDVGDVQIGNYAGSNGILWDNSTGLFTIKGNMTAGAISGTTITGNTISGGSISGTTITGNTITGGTISGTTITGSTISTGTSGSRVQMNTNGDNIQFYNSGGTEGLRAGLESSTGALIQSKDGRNLRLVSDSGTVQFGNANLGQLGNITTSGTISAGTFSGAGSFSSISMSGNIDMNGTAVREIDALNFNPRSSTPSDAGSWGQWAHSSGGTYQMRVRLNGANYSQDLTPR
jgi:hypothetical protein